MREEKIFKAHYPLTDGRDIYDMTRREKEKLAEWVYYFILDHKAIVGHEMLKVSKKYKGEERFRHTHASLHIDYSKYNDTPRLSQKIKKGQVLNLDEEDIAFINGVLYFHRYKRTMFYKLFHKYDFPIDENNKMFWWSEGY